MVFLLFDRYGSMGYDIDSMVFIQMEVIWDLAIFIVICMAHVICSPI